MDQATRPTDKARSREMMLNAPLCRAIVSAGPIGPFRSGIFVMMVH
jgi:hypothetical protein